MIIDPFKNKFFEQFIPISREIEKASKDFKYARGGEEYDLPNNIITEWFDPTQIKRMPSSRSYPHPAKEQFGDEYCLALYNANYLPLFLISTLYNDRKILIEDVGAGVGHLLVYLHALGYDNFHVIENFSQCTKWTLDKIMFYFSIQYQLNNFNSDPIVINNSGVPEASTIQIKSSTELVICYTNRAIEKWAAKYWVEDKNFVFLCCDIHDFAFAFVRKDKLEEFSNKLKSYESKKKI